MGILDFIKRDKTADTDTGMELPPVPKMEGVDAPPSSLPPLPTDFPEEVPPAPTESKLEPPKADVPWRAPADMPGKPEKIAPLPDMPRKPSRAPMQDMFQEPEDEIHAKIKAVQEAKTPEMPEPANIPEVMEPEEYKIKEPKMQFPAIPDHDAEDIVPEKIPPLEGIPEPPPGMGKKPLRTMPRPAPSRRAIEPPQPAPMEHPAIEPAPSIYIPEEEPRRTVRGPLFIRTDRFRTAIDNIEQIKAMFKEEDNIFFAINEIKNTQDQRFESFRQGLEDIQRKLLFIDRALFEKR
ncbi:hypothetical protein KY362_04855 [Candidatus Woesearchaeota archaeon]|nr:hypothetical protein [Candidatus Woesearchaeota archaeon]